LKAISTVFASIEDVRRNPTLVNLVFATIANESIASGIEGLSGALESSQSRVAADWSSELTDEYGDWTRATMRFRRALLDGPVQDADARSRRCK
jgi:hypothetical protein